MKQFIGLCLVSLILFSCKNKITQEVLEGKWIYERVEFLGQKPIVIQEKQDLELKKPFIVFSKVDSLKIYSDEKIISHGTYYIENDIIRYEEILSDGSKRKIPFLVKDLSQSKIVFQTMEKEAIRVTAAKK